MSYDTMPKCDTCLRDDFLPFKCPDCALQFCADHAKEHEKTHAVERRKVVKPKAKPFACPVCKKSAVAQVQCKQCLRSFCVRHYHVDQHRCVSTAQQRQQHPKKSDAAAKKAAPAAEPRTTTLLKLTLPDNASGVPVLLELPATTTLNELYAIARSTVPSLEDDECFIMRCGMRVLEAEQEGARSLAALQLTPSAAISIERKGEPKIRRAPSQQEPPSACCVQ